MQVANALNNIIRILYNPKVEAIKLFDILMVKSGNDRYLAQVIELFTDKFDTAQNVAKLKLFYKISENDEVIPYDNFTPSKECEIIKIEQKEVENFINENADTLTFGVNAKNEQPFEIRQDFFNNNPIIFADKAEKACEVSISIARSLSDIKNSVIIDFTGVMDIDGAKKIKAAKDFQMLLDASNLDFVFEKFLSDGSLEFQSLGLEILAQLKKFVKSQKDGFIPFNNFVKVLEAQLSATNRPEIKVLIARLKKCQQDNIFLNNVKNKNVLLNTIAKNKITVVDLSALNSSFQKRCFENLIEDIKDDVYLFARINDANSDTELINKIYTKKKNISFIPNVSFSLKKLPYLMQNCENYIMLPSLYQRTDLIEAHSRLSNLINEGCVIFGKDTENFIYFVKDYEKDSSTKKTNYRKIALSFIKEDAKPQVELRVTNVTNDSKRLLEELGSEDDFDDDASYREIENPQETLDDDFSTVSIETVDDMDEPEDIEDIEAYKRAKEADEAKQASIKENAETNEQKEEAKSTFAQELMKASFDDDSSESQNIFDEAILDDIDARQNTQEIKEEAKDESESESLSDEELDFFEAEPQENEPQDTKEPCEDEQDVKPEELENISKEDELAVGDFEEALKSNLEQVELKNGSEVLGESDEQKTVLVDNIEYKTQNNESIQETLSSEIEETEVEETSEITQQEVVEEPVATEADTVEVQEVEKEIETEAAAEEKSEDEPIQEVQESSNDEDAVEDLEETFAQNLEQVELQAQAENETIAQDNSTSEDNAEASQVDIQEQETSLPNEVAEVANDNDINTIELANDEEIDIASDDVDLSLVAGDSINESFEQIINEPINHEVIELKIDDETKIDENALMVKAKEDEDLPIFKEEIKTDSMNTQVYEVGSIVSHKKYGTGKVVKTIQYEQRQLLQIEFDEAGKKLLDPVVADIKLEQ